ncbi:unnamed protein product [Symbiodinium sp. CCMP2592]|nr:unnamed protein product [Symbiodinium sp. CCMP2592]
MAMVKRSVQNAFCQSDKLRRPKGPLWAEPCEGLHLLRGALISIEVPVYGLDDAPGAWRETVVRFLSDHGFTPNVIEPCWWVRFGKDGTNDRKQIRNLFQEHFHFGKWDNDEAEYAGRMIRVKEDRILVDQEKYLREQLRPIALVKGKRADKDSPLTEEEFQAFCAAIYKINWVAKESRPEMSGLASIMASNLKQATVEDAPIVNKNINHLSNTASRPLTVLKMSPKDLSFVVISDVGGVGAKHDRLDELNLPTDSRACLRRSATRSKLRRKVFSFFGGGVMLQVITEVDWLQIMVRGATRHDVDLRQWRNSLSGHMLCDLRARSDQCLVTDAKSLYDALLKEHPQGKQDRRSSVELAIIVKDLQETRSTLRWVPHHNMIVNALTKADPLRASGATEHYLRTGWLSVVDVAAELSAGQGT